MALWRDGVSDADVDGRGACSSCGGVDVVDVIEVEGGVGGRSTMVASIHTITHTLKQHRSRPYMHIHENIRKRTD